MHTRLLAYSSEYRKLYEIDKSPSVDNVLHMNKTKRESSIAYSANKTRRLTKV